MTNEDRFVVEGVIASVLVTAAVWLAMSRLVETPSPCREGRACLSDAIALCGVTQLRGSSNSEASETARRTKPAAATRTTDRTATSEAGRICWRNFSESRRQCVVERRTISRIEARRDAYEACEKAAFEVFDTCVAENVVAD